MKIAFIDKATFTTVEYNELVVVDLVSLFANLTKDEYNIVSTNKGDKDLGSGDFNILESVAAVRWATRIKLKLISPFSFRTII